MTLKRWKKIISKKVYKAKGKKIFKNKNKSHNSTK